MEELKVKVLDQFVLVRQIMKKKDGIIIKDMSKNQKEQFDFSFEIVQIGAKCERDIKVGDHPIFSEYVKFSGVKLVRRNRLGAISHVIVHENDIIAVDSDVLILDIGEEDEDNERKLVTLN